MQVQFRLSSLDDKLYPLRQILQSGLSEFLRTDHREPTQMPQHTTNRWNFEKKTGSATAKVPSYTMLLSY
jgi:hypothetical protein